MVWSYSCDVDSNSMVWSGYLNDAEKWGRWRSEDRVFLEYGSTKDKRVTFTSPDTQERIVVSF